jgi:hypothetical protein
MFVRGLAVPNPSRTFVAFLIQIDTRLVTTAKTAYSLTSTNLHSNNVFKKHMSWAYPMTCPAHSLRLTALLKLLEITRLS